MDTDRDQLLRTLAEHDGGDLTKRQKLPKLTTNRNDIIKAIDIFYKIYLRIITLLKGCIHLFVVQRSP